MYGDRCICQSLSLLCPCMEISVSVGPCPFYAHVWRSLYLSVLVPFMPMYGDRCICMPMYGDLCICQSLSLLCPCMEVAVSVGTCPFYAHVWRSLYLYAHVWRSLYLSVLVPFMPMYGDRCICRYLSLLCPCMEIAVFVCPCPLYAMYGDLCI